MSGALTNLPPVAPRMSASERRAQLLAVASKLFAKRGFRDTTTAQIAAAAKVTEPVIYRHFSGKRELYVECVNDAWAGVREQLETAIAAEPDPARWTMLFATEGLASMRSGDRAQLWLQLHSEATTDRVIKRFAAENLAEVHGFIAAIIARAQDQGGVAAGLDPDAEAWVVISIALLIATATRLGTLGDIDLEAVFAARQRWLRMGSAKPRT